MCNGLYFRRVESWKLSKYWYCITVIRIQIWHVKYTHTNIICTYSSNDLCIMFEAVSMYFNLDPFVDLKQNDVISQFIDFKIKFK